MTPIHVRADHVVASYSEPRARIHLTYLNDADHYDKPSGPAPSALMPTRQRTVLYEHKGTGSLLISHHMCNTAAFTAAMAAQRPEVQAPSGSQW